MVCLKSSDNTVIDQRLDDSSSKIGFTTPITDYYYYTFVIHNPYAGLFIFDKNVGIYSAVVTTTWQEDVTYQRDVDTPVTKYRTIEVPVTKYRTVDTPVIKYHDVDVPVTKYRDVNEEVTKYRDASKNITPLDMMMGKQ